MAFLLSRVIITITIIKQRSSRTFEFLLSIHIHTSPSPFPSLFPSPSLPPPLPPTLPLPLSLSLSLSVSLSLYSAGSLASWTVLTPFINRDWIGIQCKGIQWTALTALFIHLPRLSIGIGLESSVKEFSGLPWLPCLYTYPVYQSGLDWNPV